MSKWGVVRLADITSTITKGTTPTTLGYNFEKTGINFIKIESISSNGDFLYDKFEHISKLCNEKLKRSQLQEKDILFSIAGAIGRTAFVTDKILPANTNQALAIIRLNDKNILHKYVIYALTSESIYNQFESRKQGVAQLNISLKDVSELKIPLPPLEEQKQIVSTLDKVTHTIDLCNAMLEKLDLLVKSRFVEMFGDPIDNPLNWKKMQLQDIVTPDCTISYGIVQTGDEQEKGIPVFRPVDIVNGKPIRAELKKTTQEISDKYKRTILKGREMLITVRANIADTYIAGAEFKGCNVGRGIVPIRTDESIMKLEFLKHQIDNEHLNEWIKSKAKGITLIQLNMEDLRVLDLIVPPLTLQQQFAAFVEHTDKSKLAVKQVLEKAETLKKALMQEYYG